MGSDFQLQLTIDIHTAAGMPSNGHIYWKIGTTATSWCCTTMLAVILAVRTTVAVYAAIARKTESGTYSNALGESDKGACCVL